MVSNAHTLDLYVDTTTKQIYTEPGRVHMGAFVKAEGTPAKTGPPKVVEASSTTPGDSAQLAEDQSEEMKRKSAELLARISEKAEKARFVN